MGHQIVSSLLGDRITSCGAIWPLPCLTGPSSPNSSSKKYNYHEDQPKNTCRTNEILQNFFKTFPSLIYSSTHQSRSQVWRNKSSLYHMNVGYSLTAYLASPGVVSSGCGSPSLAAWCSPRLLRLKLSSCRPLCAIAWYGPLPFDVD